MKATWESPRNPQECCRRKLRVVSELSRTELDTEGAFEMLEPARRLWSIAERLAQRPAFQRANVRNVAKIEAKGLNLN